MRVAIRLLMPFSLRTRPEATFFQQPHDRKLWEKDTPDELVLSDIPVAATEEHAQLYATALDWDYMMDLHLRAYEEGRLVRATNDVLKFLKDVIPPVLNQHLHFVRSRYTSLPMNQITPPLEVAAEPGIQQYIRSEAERVERQLVHAVRMTEQMTLPKVQWSETKWNVLTSKFKHGKTKHKVSEEVYHTVLPIRLPIRDPELEARFHAVPLWLPLGVEAHFVIQRIETLSVPSVVTKDLGDLYEGKSMLERYFPQSFLQGEKPSTDSPVKYAPRHKPNPNKKKYVAKKKKR